MKFNKFNVTDGETKVRVHYNLDNRVDGRKCVTLYAKDYDGDLLGELFADDYKNDSDIYTDYFEKGKANLFEGNKHYAAARKRAEANAVADEARREKRYAKERAKWAA